MELYATDKLFKSKRWENSPIPEEHEIKGFFNATLWVDNIDQTEDIIVNLLGYKKESTEGFITRYSLDKDSSGSAKYLDIQAMKGWVEGIQSAGTVHHIAFGIQGYDKQQEFIKKIKSFQLNPTEQIDRNYFKSVYFREPGGILFEIATTEPGFLVDEKLEELGNNLKLPQQYEKFRDAIEANLPPLYTSNNAQEEEIEYENKDEVLYTHKYLKSESELTFILFHGTGADENDLIPLAKEINSEANILSLRGDVEEYGMNRFFKRISEGVFDQDDIKFRAAKLEKFLKQAIEKYKLDLNKTVFLGYSNGANIIAALLLLHPEMVNNAVLIRAVNPLDKFNTKKALPENKEKKVLILSGIEDPYSLDEKVELLVKNLKLIGITNVERKVTGEGHSMNGNDVKEIKEFVFTV